MAIEIPYVVCSRCRSVNGSDCWVCYCCGVVLNG